MDITSKASITVSAKLSQVEIGDALIEAVKGAAVKGDISGMVLSDSHVSLVDDGTSATVELIYEKAEAPAAPAADPAPAAAVIVDTALATPAPSGITIPSAV